jgi:hypothetical protein
MSSSREACTSRSVRCVSNGTGRVEPSWGAAANGEALWMWVWLPPGLLCFKIHVPQWHHTTVGWKEGS